MHNTITATIGGIAVDPLTFDFQCDESSYCWRGDIDITAKDYERIKLKLHATAGNEPTVVIVLNGVAHAFIAEEHTRSRRFASHTHRISGRSASARIGKSYATPGRGVIDESLYASQIVTQVLNQTGITLSNFGVPDWLVPANTYSLTGKTPIDVVSDIASAAGAFVESDLSNATIEIVPRWKQPAWNLSTATPDLIVPMNIVRQMDDQILKRPRYNTVTLIGATEGRHIYRQTQSRTLDAPVGSNTLFTDDPVMLSAGVAILSDSGKHAEYSIVMRHSAKHNIPLAKRGQIWQINDTEGSWLGVIRGVNLSTKKQNDAPTVWQSVSIDRYLDV